MLEHLELERSQAMLLLHNSLIERQVNYRISARRSYFCLGLFARLSEALHVMDFLGGIQGLRPGTNGTRMPCNRRRATCEYVYFLTFV